MQDIADKFPDWLADNRTKIPDQEFVKYNKQFDLTKRICHLFEEESENETEEKKKARYLAIYLNTSMKKFMQ